MASLHEISRAIGALESGHHGINNSLSDMKAQLAKISERLQNIPPSSTCIEEHKAIRSEIANIKISNAKQAGMISAGIAVLAVVGKSIAAKLGLIF